MHSDVCHATAKAYVCIENVLRRNTGTVVQRELEELGYCCQVIFANAASFGVPQSRSRVYIVGALRQKVRIFHGPDCWCQWLEVCDFAFIAIASLKSVLKFEI